MGHKITAFYLETWPVKVKVAEDFLELALDSGGDKVEHNLAPNLSDKVAIRKNIK